MSDAFRVEHVDAAEAARVGGPILRAAWSRPGLHYSDAYLAWELTMPGEGALFTVGLVDGEPVAFMASVPRRAAFGSGLEPVLVSSFVSVLPRVAGRGIARELQAAHLGRLLAERRKVVSFAWSGSRGARTFENSSRSVGYHFIPLAPRTVLAALPRPVGEPEPTVHVLSSPSDGLSRHRHPLDVLVASPSRAQLEHYARDPRQRVFLEVPGERGGTASFVLAEVLGESGVDRVVSLDLLDAPAGVDALALRALVRAAASHFADRASTPIVSVSATEGLAPDTSRSAGWRRTPTTFDARFLSPDPVDVPPRGTTLEIV
jgi:hypothetical protein